MLDLGPDYAHAAVVQVAVRLPNPAGMRTWNVNLVIDSFMGSGDGSGERSHTPADVGTAAIVLARPSGASIVDPSDPEKLWAYPRDLERPVWLHCTDENECGVTLTVRFELGPAATKATIAWHVDSSVAWDQPHLGSDAPLILIDPPSWGH